MKIDLHVHTQERSSCGKSSEEEQIRAAMAMGLDAIVFTDHDGLAPPGRLQELNQKYAPFKVFGGIEVSIGNEHLLVLGVQDYSLESCRWSYPALHRFVRERGGFIAVAHPFRFNPESTIEIDLFPPDALEAYSNNIPKQAETRLRNLARQLNIPVLSNSDGHQTDKLGRYYNLLDATPANSRELIEILKAGQFTCVTPE